MTSSLNRLKLHPVPAHTSVPLSICLVVLHAALLLSGGIACMVPRAHDVLAEHVHSPCVAPDDCSLPAGACEEGFHCHHRHESHERCHSAFAIANVPVRKHKQVLSVSSLMRLPVRVPTLAGNGPGVCLRRLDLPPSAGSLSLLHSVRIQA